MIKRFRNRHFFFLDVIIIPIVAYVSFVLRLDRLDLTPFWAAYVVLALTALFIIPAAFRAVGLYSRFWQYASVEELLLISGTTTLACMVVGIVSFALVVALPGTVPYARSAPFIFLFLALGGTAGPRFLVRLYARGQIFRQRPTGPVKMAAIMGAGDAGAMMLRELQNNPQLNIHVAAFLDDDESKHGMRIHGVPVVGNRHDIPRLVQKMGLNQIVIAMPTAPGKTIRAIVDLCEQARVQPKIIPGIYELIGGRVSVKQLRDVNIEDLLRREPVQTDTHAVRELLHGRRVLVTGGGGSIGRELCRQILRCEPAELLLLGHGENSIFEIYHELRTFEGVTTTKVRPLIADVRFAGRLDVLFARHRPEVIFHAAAHKHVPLMELNAPEAITNNVVGTRNVLAAAVKHGVERFVMISTDKAVNPNNVMGASKRTAELLVHQTAQRHDLPYVAVRFGNVLGSRGSVIPTFRKQIAAGGPVTVTHPEMCRYFMTIPEAVQLVLQASVLGKGREVFVLDMGEPVKIMDLARDLIELSGYEVGRDIDITLTGPRPGDKLFEELFVEGETYTRTAHEKIFVAENASTLPADDLDASIEALIAAADRSDAEAISGCFERLIPDFKPAGAPERTPLDKAAGEITRPAMRPSLAN